MERIQNTLKLDPISMNLGEVQLSPPTRDENGVSFKAKFQVCLVETAKTAAIGGAAGAAIGGSVCMAIAVKNNEDYKKRGVQGAEIGFSIGAFLAGIFGAKSAYNRMVEMSVRINDYVHPNNDTPEYKEAKRLGTEILKLYFRDKSTDSEEFFCPISCELMKFPVKANDKKVYEYDKISEWIHQHPEGVGSSPFRICKNTMEDLEHQKVLADLIGEKVSDLVSNIEKLSGLKQNELDAHFKEAFRKGSIVLEDLTNISPQQVVHKMLTKRKLLNKEILCLNVVLKPFIEMTKRRHDAIFDSTEDLLTSHRQQGIITRAKEIELKTSLNEWYLKNKID